MINICNTYGIFIELKNGLIKELNTIKQKNDSMFIKNDIFSNNEKLKKLCIKN